ncbi:MAG: DUF2232 domain-containing protein [Deltaproteobacteria bacterium]|nr:DUF2232 domain-containing protein [Deltaproteobacteria bacterium]
MTVKNIAALARAAFASALMFLAGAMIPLVGGAVMMFAPTPLLGYAAGLPHALSRISFAIALAAALVAFGGGVAAATAYVVSFGLAAALICFMLERRQRFELIVLAVTTSVVVVGTGAAVVLAGSPSAFVQMIRNQLVAAMMRGESFYKTLGVEAAITADSRAYLIETVMRLTPPLVVSLGALMVLLNLAVFWRWGGKEQRVGYTLFGDLVRWSAPEWLVWPLLVSGFGWFIPVAPVATIALDCFLCIVAVYFCQGLAIMAFYFRQLKMPAVARGLIYFVTLAQPILMAIVGAAGIFDLWVDFRRLKPPNAATRKLGDFL